MSQRLNKFQLCTCHLKVPTHQSIYIYGFDNAKNFRHKDILTLGKQHFEQMHHSISMKILHITH